MLDAAHERYRLAAMLAAPLGRVRGVDADRAPAGAGGQQSLGKEAGAGADVEDFIARAAIQELQQRRALGNIVPVLADAVAQDVVLLDVHRATPTARAPGRRTCRKRR